MMEALLRKESLVHQGPSLRNDGMVGIIQNTFWCQSKSIITTAFEHQLTVTKCSVIMPVCWMETKVNRLAHKTRFILLFAEGQTRAFVN